MGKVRARVRVRISHVASPAPGCSQLPFLEQSNGRLVATATLLATHLSSLIIEVGHFAAQMHPAKPSVLPWRSAHICVLACSLPHLHAESELSSTF